MGGLFLFSHTVHNANTEQGNYSSQISVRVQNNFANDTTLHFSDMDE